MKILDLFVAIQGDISDLSKALDTGEKQLLDFSRTATKVGENLTKSITAPLLKAGKEIVNAAADAELAQKKLQSALKQTGQEVNANARSISNLASALQEQTRFEDDAIVSASALLTQLGQLDAQGVQKVLPGILDFAEAMGVDLETAAQLVAKTMGGTTNALGRYGIQVDGTADQSTKLAQITDQLTLKFGGAAKAGGETFSGKLAQLQNKVGDLAEEFGGALLPVLSDLIESVKPIVEGFTNLDDGTKKMIVTLAGVAAIAGPVTTAIGGITKAFAVLGSAPLVAIGGIIALVTAVEGLRDEVSLTAKEAGELAGQVVDIKNSANAVIGPVNELTKNQKLSQDQINELIRLYPELDKALIANKTTTIEAAEAVRLATIAKNKEVMSQIESQYKAFLGATTLLTVKTNEELQKIANDKGPVGAFADSIRNAAKEIIGLRTQYSGLIDANKALSVTTEQQIALDAKRNQAASALAALEKKAAEDKEAAEKKVIDLAEERAEIEKRIAERTVDDGKALFTDYNDFLIAQQDARLAKEDEDALAFIKIAQERAEAELAIHNEQQEALQESTDETEKARVDAEEAATKQIQANQKILLEWQEHENKAALEREIEMRRGAADLIEQIAVGVFNSLMTLNQLYTDAIMRDIDARLQAEIEAAGVAEETTLERLNRELTAAIEAGDEEEASRLRNAIKRSEIEERFSKERAQAEYEGAKFAHGLQVLSSIAAGAQAVLMTFAGLAQFGPIVAGIGAAAAGVFAAVQIAAVAASAPQPPAFALGTGWAGGGMALVGERGPELVNLPTGASVTSNARTEPMLQNMTNNSPTYVFNSPVPLDTWEIKKRIMLQGRMERLALNG